MKIKAHILLFILCPLSLQVLAQETIYLHNSSFEGPPHKGIAGLWDIEGWTDCGTLEFPSNSPPDLLPSLLPSPAWEVTTQAFDGETYLSMVVRDDHSWESVGQKLDKVLMAGQCYSITASLSMSPVYLSATASSRNNYNSQRSQTQYPKGSEPKGSFGSGLASFANAVILVIWGGHSKCDKAEILAESSPVNHSDWKQVEFTFTPTEDFEYIIFEVYYAKSSPADYNGHLLLDNLSAITKVTCD